MTLLQSLDPPTTVAELTQVLDSYRAELEASPAALDACRFLLDEPPLAVRLRPRYAMLAAGAIALLPEWAREQLELSNDPVRGMVRERVGRLATRAARWGLGGLR